MSVLKDAATAAIYGARAAAGVILIETLPWYQIQTQNHVLSLLGSGSDSQETGCLQCRRIYPHGKDGPYKRRSKPQNWPAYIAAYEQTHTVWRHRLAGRILPQRLHTEIQCGYTSGSENANVAFVRILFKNEAIVTGTGDEKYGFRLNSDMKRGKFKVGESVNYSRWESEMEANSGFPGIYQVTNMEPIARLYDENCDGGYGGAIPGMNMSDAANMVGYNNLIENTCATDYIKGSGYLQYEPIKGLVIKAQASRSLLFPRNPRIQTYFTNWVP